MRRTKVRRYLLITRLELLIENARLIKASHREVVWWCQWQLLCVPLRQSAGGLALLAAAPTFYDLIKIQGDPRFKLISIGGASLFQIKNVLDILRKYKNIQSAACGGKNIFFNPKRPQTKTTIRLTEIELHFSKQTSSTIMFKRNKGLLIGRHFITTICIKYVTTCLFEFQSDIKAHQCSDTCSHKSPEG